MPENPRSGEYDVGFGKPPQHTQFQPGQSGNPKGRPKKTSSIPEALAKTSNLPVSMIINGRKQKVSLLEAIVKKHFAKALEGDSKSASLIFSLYRQQPPDSGDPVKELVQEFRLAHARAQPSAPQPEQQRDTQGGPSDAEV